MKRDIYAEVTDRVIGMLEKGVAPWRRPWKVAGLLPRNLRSGRSYRGINLIFLSMAGFGSPYWVTYRQAQELGGRVRAGAKGTTVIFWQFLQAIERDDADGSRSRRVPLLRCYTVFNLEQTEEIPVPPSTLAASPIECAAPLETAEAILAGMTDPPEVRHGGPVACYDARADVVLMPPRTAFTSPESYYSTLYHELGHATGHVKRLARPGIVGGGHFGGHNYSKEELIAEFASAFLCAHVGIECEVEQSAAYLQGWLSALRDDKKMLVQAAGSAQKATDYILGVTFDEKPETSSSATEELAAAA
jgi:antirestriction protein ArdC